MRIRNIVLLGLLIPSLAFASLTANKVPVTKVGGVVPDIEDGDITDNGSSVLIPIPTSVQGSPVCTQATGCGGTFTVTSPITYSGGIVGILQSGTSSSGYLSSNDWNTFNGKQTNLGFLPGSNINGDVCIWTTGGTVNCTGAPAGTGTVTTLSVVSANGLAGSVASASSTPAITLSTTITGILKGNGTAISSATSGTDYAPATTGSSILKASSGGFANAVGGTDYAVATTGTNSQLLANNGSGGFSNVTVGSNLTLSGGTLSSSGSGTPGGTSGQIQYNNSGSFGGYTSLNHTYVNWSDMNNLGTQTINWGGASLLTPSITTNGGVTGFMQFWNAAKTYFMNMSVNSNLGASYGINWPANAPTAGQVAEVMDSFGDVNWVSATGLGGINWQALPQIVQSYNVNWYDVNNLTNGGKINTGGVNWNDMINNTTTINWNDSQSMKALTVNGTGVGITGVGTCSSHTGTMSCIGTGGCLGYVTAYTAYNNLTCVCC